MHKDFPRIFQLFALVYFVTKITKGALFPLASFYLLMILLSVKTFSPKEQLFFFLIMSTKLADDPSAYKHTTYCDHRKRKKRKPESNWNARRHLGGFVLKLNNKITNTVILGCLVSGCPKSLLAEEEIQRTLTHQLLTITASEFKNLFIQLFLLVHCSSFSSR